jgi:hypothetical protein
LEQHLHELYITPYQEDETLLTTVMDKYGPGIPSGSQFDEDAFAGDYINRYCHYSKESD